MTDQRNDGSPRTPPDRPTQPQDGQKPGPRGLLLWASILLLFLLMFGSVMSAKQEDQETISYSEFKTLVEATPGRLGPCEIIKEVSGGEFVEGTVLPAEDAVKGTKAHKFRVQLIEANEAFGEYLRAHNVKVTVAPAHFYFWQILSGVLPVLLIFGLLYFLFVRQVHAAGHGALSFGKSRARMLNRDKNKVTFKNVAGIDEAKDEVQEIIEFLKDPKKFQKLGGRIPKGVLLTGPPGTGKTLLAKAIAGEANVPFFNISGSDFVEMFVGVGASRVRDMFEQGKKHAPCIIFIDEIDAVGRSRFSGIGGGHDEREQTLNALLVQMDGFETQEGLIILAATNRPDVLDRALMRPGRFDRQIIIDLPTIDGRVDILKIHSQGVKLGPDCDLRRIARGTPGFSGADLENLINEAALLGARHNKEAIELTDLEEARDKVRWGRERRSRVLDDKEKKIAAYHEAGHALAMIKSKGNHPIHKITIIPRGVAYLGATMQLPERDRYTEQKHEVIAALVGLMGGRVAEELVFKDVTSGASSDIKHATYIARMMVCSWGMSEVIGMQSFGEGDEMVFLGREVSRKQEYSEQTAQKIDQEIARILREAHEKATQILTEHRATLELLAQTLLERETLDSDDVDDLMRHGRLLSLGERTAQAGETPSPDNPTGPVSAPAVAPDTGIPPFGQLASA